MDARSQASESRGRSPAAGRHTARHESHRVLRPSPANAPDHRGQRLPKGENSFNPHFLWKFLPFPQIRHMLNFSTRSSSFPQILSSETAPLRRMSDAEQQYRLHYGGDGAQDKGPNDWVWLSNPGVKDAEDTILDTPMVAPVLPLELERLYIKRLDLMAMRVKVREARTSLKHARTSMRDSDARFERVLRKVFESDIKFGLREIEDDYENLQHAREVVRVQEDAYDRLEAELLSLEFEMRQLEEEIYGIPLETSTTSLYTATELDISYNTMSRTRKTSPEVDVVTNTPSDHVVSTVKSHQSTADRLSQLRKQIEQLRGTQMKLESESQAVKQRIDSTPEEHGELYEERMHQLQLISERRSDISIQLMLLEEDMMLLDDLAFYQMDHFFSVELTAFSDIAPPPTSTTAISRGKGDDQDLQFNLHLSDKPPSRYLAFRDLRTKATQNIAPELSSNDLDTMPNLINAWLLQNLCSSQFNVLRLHAEFTNIEHKSLTLRSWKPLQRERKAARSWFSDGSELLYLRGRHLDVMSVSPLTSSHLSRTEHDLWESRAMTLAKSLATDGETVIYYRSHSTEHTSSPTAPNDDVFSLKKSTGLLTGDQKNAKSEPIGQTFPFPEESGIRHPVISSLESRPRAIHYLLQLWNSPICLQPPQQIGPRF